LLNTELSVKYYIVRDKVQQIGGPVAGGINKNEENILAECHERKTPLRIHRLHGGSRGDLR
jgi:hypothetical protein